MGWYFALAETVHTGGREGAGGERRRVAEADKEQEEIRGGEQILRCVNKWIFKCILAPNALSPENLHEHCSAGWNTNVFSSRGRLQFDFDFSLYNLRIAKADFSSFKSWKKEWVVFSFSFWQQTHHLESADTITHFISPQVAGLVWITSSEVRRSTTDSRDFDKRPHARWFRDNISLALSINHRLKWIRKNLQCGYCRTTFTANLPATTDWIWSFLALRITSW